MVLMVVAFVSCKTTKLDYTQINENYTCVEDPSRIGLLDRVGDCAAALSYMQAVLEFGTLREKSEKEYQVEYKLRGINHDLLSARNNYRHFHLSPECFVGLEFGEVVTLSESEHLQIQSRLADQVEVDLYLVDDGRSEMRLTITADKKISSAAWIDNLSDKEVVLEDTITNYYLGLLGTSSVTIEYTQAVIGSSRKTVSTKNNTLLIVTEITGDSNNSHLRCLSRCYFNPEHFIGLSINEFLEVFRIESLGQVDIDIISRILVNIKGHSQLILGVKEDKILDFRFN